MQYITVQYNYYRAVYYRKRSIIILQGSSIIIYITGQCITGKQYNYVTGQCITGKAYNYYREVYYGAVCLQGSIILQGSVLEQYITGQRAVYYKEYRAV